jgi:hypothetical protein
VEGGMLLLFCVEDEKLLFCLVLSSWQTVVEGGGVVFDRLNYNTYKGKKHQTQEDCFFFLSFGFDFSRND